jgi:hypothetical protein
VTGPQDFWVALQNRIGRLLVRASSAELPRIPESLLDRIARLPAAILLIASYTIFITLSLVAASQESCVDDEIPHLPAGFTYLTTHDYRLNPEHPPLAKVIAALPLMFMKIRWPEDASSWSAGEEWTFGYRLLYHSGNDTETMVFWGRVFMLVWPLILIGSIYGVAKDLYGPKSGLITLFVSTFCPEFLAHGHLVTTDAPVATLTFLSSVSCWQFSEKPTLLRALIAGCLLGGAIVVKFSSVMLLPALLLFGGVAFVTRGRRQARPQEARRRQCLERVRITAVVALVPFVAYGIVWATYGFRYSASSDPTFAFPWSFALTEKSTIGRLVGFARTHRLLPEAFLYGFSFMFEHAQARGAYALGHYSSTGWWWYFPFAFLVKTPISILILVGWGLAAWVRRNVTGHSREHFLIIPLVIFWVLAINSRMNIGLRHLLPVYPYMIVLAGGIRLASLHPIRTLWRIRIVACLLIFSAAESLLSAPYFLTHFNLPSLLLWERHSMLVDSNLDWGQDLARLKKYIDRRGIGEIKLAYRGNASPRQLGLQHQHLPGIGAYIGRGLEPEWRAARSWGPGDTVAISASCLVGLFFENTEYYQRDFRKIAPIAVIGHSIYVYRIPSEAR